MGLSSGEYGGRGIREIFSGSFWVFERWEAAPSSTRIICWLGCLLLSSLRKIFRHSVSYLAELRRHWCRLVDRRRCRRIANSIIFQAPTSSPPHRICKSRHSLDNNFSSPQGRGISRCQDVSRGLRMVGEGSIVREYYELAI